MNSEDFYYKEKIKNGIYPLQIGKFVFKTDKEKFEKIKDEMIKDTVTFKKKFLTKTNENIYFNNIDDLQVVQLKINEEKQKINFFLNHELVGGSDYISLGTHIFKGTGNSLVTYVDTSIFVKLFLAVMFIFYNIPLIFKKNIKKLNGDYIKLSINKIIIDNNINKKKYILIHSILNDLINNTKLDNLYCWLPIGFERYENCPNNNIGILTFNFKRNMTINELEKTIENRKFLVIGSKYIIDNSNTISQLKYFNLNRYIRKKIDVVLTLGNIMGVPDYMDNSIHDLNGYFGKEMLDDTDYPFYIWGITINNKAYLTYNIKMENFNIDNLKKNHDYVGNI